MTVGSVNMTNLPIGRVYELDWSGTDRPKVKYLRRKRVTVERDGVIYRYLEMPQSDQLVKPPKRVLNTPHGFTKTWKDLYEGDSAWIENNNCEGQSLVELNIGSFKAAGLIQTSHSDGTSVDAALIDNNDWNAAFSKLRERTTGSDFNMSVFLGEGHQTLGLITNSAERIVKSMLKLWRRDPLGAARALVDGTDRVIKPINHRKFATGTLSSNWLELQYGWLPLLGDTRGAAESLAHAMEVPFRKKFTVRKRKEKMSTKQYGLNGPCRDNRTYASWYSCDRLQIHIEMAERPSLSWTLGLENPELVAWELLPWSFVIDWFLPIGQYLEARAATSLMQAGTVISYSHRAKYLGCTGALPQLGGRYKRGNFTRYVYDEPNTLPTPFFDRIRKVPQPNFKGLNEALSWRHCANAIALLGSLASGVKTNGFGYPSRGMTNQAKSRADEYFKHFGPKD